MEVPQLTIRGVKAEDVCKISRELIDELEALLECPRSYFTIECANAVFIADGEFTDGYPFVEIAWFDRGQEIQDRAAEIITRYIQDAGYKNVDIYFKVLLKNNYYENGKHF